MSHPFIKLTPEEKVAAKEARKHNLPIIAKGVIVSPVDPELWAQLGSAAFTMCNTIGWLIFRLLMLALYPISVPLMTWLSGQAYVVNKRAADKAQREWLDEHNSGV